MDSNAPSMTPEASPRRAGVSLAERMKTLEHEYRHVLPGHGMSVLRVDGRAFSRWTRDLVKPFDPEFTAAMQVIAKALCVEVQNAQMAYVQSDEVSVLVDVPEGGQPWFGGVIAKQVSVAAALVTARFNDTLAYMGLPLALFDARVSVLPQGGVDALAYLRWRQRDAIRNSIHSLARTHFTHGELRGVTASGAKALLAQQRGVLWDELPVGLQRGSVCVLRREVHRTEWLDGRTGTINTDDVARRYWLVQNAPDFAALDGFGSLRPDSRNITEPASDLIA